MKAASLTACGLAVRLASAADAEAPVQRVSFDELREAMRAEQGYDLGKTNNLGRFQAGVILRLAARAEALQPQGPPLFLDHAEWFRAYLEVARLSAERVSISSRLSYQNRQDAWVEYRPQLVVRQAGTRRSVRRALNVLVAPRSGVSLPARYSYDETTSTPRLRISVEREYHYRLLDLGDQRVFDEIVGLHGRPTSGLLGALFAVLGEGHAVFSRLAIAEDEVQLVVGQARKAFLTRTATVTIRPDGTAEPGVPAGRADLLALEARLREPLGIVYWPWRDPREPAR